MSTTEPASQKYRQKFRQLIRKALLLDPHLLVLAALIGLLAGLASTAFRWMIHFVDSIFSGESLALIGITGSILPFVIPLIPMMGGLAIGVICHFFPDAVKENGVHQVMHMVALKNGRIRPRTILSASTTSAITIGSGGSAGREGPTVQIGAAVGSLIGQWLHVSTDRMRVLVGCGAAAGIAASFNAPLAGVLFAMEIILGDFTIHTFSPIVIASVIGTVTGRALEGNAVTFEVPFHELVSHTEIIFYLILGLLCGLVASLFSTTYFKSSEFFEERVNIPKILKPALGGLIVGLMSIAVPQVLGNGYDAMGQALNGQMFWGLALALVFLKILATAITLGSGGMGGIFAPSLFIGAMTGSVFGAVIHSISPQFTASPETYAVVGMGAVAGAVMQAPLTNILMLFELTNDYTLILPIMATCIVSTYVFRGRGKISIYIEYLLRKGINIKHGREVSILNAIKVKDVMTKEITTIPEGMTFRRILETVSYSKSLYFPVVNQQGDVTGILSFSDLREVFFEEGLDDLVIASTLATHEVVYLHPNQNLNEAMEQFARLDIEQLPVSPEDNPRKVIGMINRGDVVAAYNREVLVHKFER
ncbi:MAG: chloride channel protein [Candidatus Nitrohelix vancouverensis]|uniref:Chloride channel protein n=1 Tax=Candidatus Nitrohelix vancouverensis TaxID=2705534 RepID=A0A7T0C3B7_9BACT|nr:MAG: chloride channel protein [Candidatus Nitrohelix vancouverensis]